MASGAQYNSRTACQGLTPDTRHSPIIEIGELKRLREIIEDLSEIKAFKGKKKESKEAFKIPVEKPKAFRIVKPIQGKGILASELLIKDRQ